MPERLPDILWRPATLQIGQRLWIQNGKKNAKRWKDAVFGMKKGFSKSSENPTRGEYEIRTREAVTPTRFPSVRHRPLGEFSNYATSHSVYPRNAT